MAEAVLGVDLGTTATKVIAVDRSARVLFSTEHDYPLHTTPSGEATHDPLQVLDAAFRALGEAAAWCTSSGVEVTALSLTGAMHTLLALDANGDPLTGSLSWADTRATEQTSLLRGTAEGAALHQATGTPIHPFAPLSKLAWFSRHEPDLARTARWCGLKDFIGLKLTDHLATEHSSASGTGLMDIHRLAWHPDSLTFAGIAETQLPDLLAPTDSHPLTADVPGLPKGLPVIMGGGDGPLANLGVGAVVPGVAALSLGTSGALRVVRDRPGVDDRGRVFCYAIAEGLWVLGGAVSNGGIVAQWAAETFNVDVGDLLDEAATVPVGANGLLSLPYLLAERAPWWDPDPRATLVGLRKEHGRAEITRALVEGVGQQLALVLDAVRSAGARVDTVRVTGGAFRSELWAAVLASALGMKLELADDSEGSGVGAALIAWRALGAIPSLTTAATLIVPTKTIIPDPTAVEHYARTRPLVERVYHALHDLTGELNRH